MTIEQVLRTKKLPSENVAALDLAFNMAMKSLGLVDRDDPLTGLVARTIFAVGQSGLESGLGDPATIAEATVDQLRRLWIVNGFVSPASGSLSARRSRRKAA